MVGSASLHFLREATRTFSMMTPFEDGFDALKKLQSGIARSGPRDRNEATTRLHLIDRLFFDCLGWDRSECTVEESLGGTYADYHFRSQVIGLIVEAKKQGVSFELPAGTTQQIQRISHFKIHQPKVYSAIKQAVGYCTNRGVQFGAVSNGHQILAFLGSRTDGTPPLEGQTLVFPDVMKIGERDFLLLWNMLSNPGLRERNLLSRLRAGEPTPPPEKLASRLPSYPGNQIRNDLQINLQILADVLIQDIGLHPDQEREFLEKCYAESGALSQYALVSRRILETRYDQFSLSSVPGPQMSPATTRTGLNANIFADSAARRPILLIGDVGVGKTTFIRNWIRVVARDLVEKSIVLYMDLGIKPTMTMDLHKFIADEITRQLRDTYEIDLEEESFLRGVYHSDLQSFDRGVWGSFREHDYSTYLRERANFLIELTNDTHNHLKKCLEHITKGRQLQVIMFFDNLDQRPDDFQQAAFLLGQSVAELWPAMVFLTLRPETYHRSRSSGTLNAYHQRAFTIAPPRIDRVVEKRLRYVLDMLEEGRMSDGQVFVAVPSLRSFLEVLAYSFRRNDELIEFIDNVCGGNVRLALEFIKVFIGSGHVDTKKIIDIYEQSGRYLVPLHEFLRAVMYGDHRWYDPNATEIKNVFDVSERDGREHFIILSALAFVDRRGQQSNSGGFVPGEEVGDHLSRLGFRTSQVEESLDRIVRWKLVESGPVRTGDERVTSLEAHFRLTTIGAYYFRKLVGTFQYLDTVLVDTPVIDSEVRATIRDVRSIVERLSRAERFCAYLDQQWAEVKEAGSVFDWESAASEARDEIRRIRERVTVG